MRRPWPHEHRGTVSLARISWGLSGNPKRLVMLWLIKRNPAAVLAPRPAGTTPRPGDSTTGLQGPHASMRRGARRGCRSTSRARPPRLGPLIWKHRSRTGYPGHVAVGGLGGGLDGLGVHGGCHLAGLHSLPGRGRRHVRGEGDGRGKGSRFRRRSPGRLGRCRQRRTGSAGARRTSRCADSLMRSARGRRAGARESISPVPASRARCGSLSAGPATTPPEPLAMPSARVGKPTVAAGSRGEVDVGVRCGRQAGTAVPGWHRPADCRDGDSVTVTSRSHDPVNAAFGPVKAVQGPVEVLVAGVTRDQLLTLISPASCRNRAGRRRISWGAA